MPTSRTALASIARSTILTCLLALTLAVASHRAATAQPRALDVPYVPTPEAIVEAMLRLAKPTKDDVLIDLGCGDGRIPIMAAQRYGTRGLGVDLNPQRIKEARTNAAKAGVTHHVEFAEGDLFKTDITKATVLTLYLLPMVNMRLRPALLDLKPGTRIVSHAFHMEDWEPDISEQHDIRSIYYWVVPAKVAGRWQGSIGTSKLELVLEQKFQKATGTAVLDGKPAKIGPIAIAGEEIAFELTRPDGRLTRIEGRVSGASFKGGDVSLVRQ